MGKMIKRDLIIMSISPLFILIMLKIIRLPDDSSNQHIHLVLLTISTAWILYSALACYKYKAIQGIGFRSDGERVKAISNLRGGGLTFLAIYIIPLMIGDIGTAGGFLMLLTMVAITVLLLWKTDQYYRNPLLILCGYHVFGFRTDGEECVGISMQDIKTGTLIDKKRITGNVYMVWSEEQRNER